MKPIVTEHALINGTRIAYGIHGTSGEDVVLIHGTPSSSLIWRKVAPSLVAAGYRVHVYDLLGYGLSERPWDSAVDTSVSGQVPILEALFGLWRLDTAHIIAHDIGGAVAQRFAIYHTHRVRSLALIDIVSFDSWPSARTKQQMKDGLETLIKAPDQTHRAHFREWLLSTVKDTSSFADSSLDTFLDYISGPIGQASLFQHQVRHYDPKHTMEIADRMHELGKIPVQLIWGRDDGWQVLDWARKLQEAIPGSKLDIINDCGHFSPEDQPEKIAEILTRFLQASQIA